MAKGQPQPTQRTELTVDPKARVWTRWGALKRERSSWDSHAKELAQNFMPRSSRFFVQDRNRGDKRHNAIYDNTGIKATRVLGAGLMAGMTSPARPWFKLRTPDADLMKYGPVKLWCSQVTQMMQSIFASSNTYRSLHTTYGELGVFGTHPTLIMPDFKNVIRCHPLTFGEYAIAASANGDIDTLYREFQKPVSSLVEEFGYENCSTTVQNLYDRGDYDSWVTVVHAVEPRRDYDTTKRDAQNMPWRSCYFEQEGKRDKYLRDSGFKSFPAVSPRWHVVGGDIYGESPGMEALGDTKQLQHEQLRKAQGIDYYTKPPVQAPSSARGQEIDLLPGGVSYVDSASPNGGIRSSFEVKLDLEHLLMDIQDVRNRINSAYYVDMFLMLANSQNETQMTATEVAERHEEKLLMIGPVLERLHNELLSPLIDMTFDRMVEANILPPPPPELHGMDLDVQFVSMLAQAQQAVSTNAVDKWTNGLGHIAALGKTDVLDKLDEDAWADWYADSLGVDPRMITADDKIALVRNGRAQQAAAAQKEAQATQAADNASKLGKVSTQGGASNMGADVAKGLAASAGGPLVQGVDPVGMFSGYQSPQAGR